LWRGEGDVSLDSRERLIVALDLPSVPAADAMVTQLGASVQFYKIGYQLAFAGGLPFAAKLIAAGKKVFLDLKLHDIGNTVTKGVESVEQLGASGLAVLYTTHYMEEAERLCDRVGIIDHGRMVAEGTHRELVDLVSERDRVELETTGDVERFARACSTLPDGESASASGGLVHVLTGQGRRVLLRLFELAEANQAVVRSARVVEPDLEAVFLHLTGSALRE